MLEAGPQRFEVAFVAVHEPKTANDAQGRLIDRDGVAAEALLDIMRRDRKWNEEAARKQLVQLFEAWGPKDPATLEGRRRLSSLMFS